MPRIDEVMTRLNNELAGEKPQHRISFETYLSRLADSPRTMLRDIFQLVYDMVNYYVPPGIDEFPDDPESVHYLAWDFAKLFIRNSDSPYFADRLFGNRFMSLINSFDRAVDRNRIYLFEGPPGSGKSTFLNNFLDRFEKYMRSDAGESYETTWKIEDLTDETLIINCPNHDHPVLQIPPAHRKEFLYDIIRDREFRERLFSEKKFSWIFEDEPCTICTSLFAALSERTGSPEKVYRMLFPRRMQYSRRLGEGVSVYNPGDQTYDKPVNNPAVQKALDELFGDSSLVKYIHSEYARTNNGIYVVMDIKQHNKMRLLDLHSVVSDGIHKVESIEENINSLFIGLMNPQDKKIFEKNPALQDRINIIKMPYVLDFKTEVQIYKNIFGPGIEQHFLPQILEDFAKLIIASRLGKESKAVNEWIGDSSKYSKVCDPDLVLLRMSIYAGTIPEWISDDDRRAFKAGVRRKILAEAEEQGFAGITGRESIRVFHDFYALYSKTEKLINMQMLQDFYNRNNELQERVPADFVESLIDSYDYTILQQVKESLYFYNRSRISKDIQNYIFAMNFDTGTVEKNSATGQTIEITEEFLRGIETYLFPGNPSEAERTGFRNEIQQRYISSTVNEIQLDGLKLIRTGLYRELLEIYTRNLKTNALDPFKESDSFRNAVKEYNTRDFQSHDKKIRKDVTFLIHKLMNRFNYSENGAKDVCIYVIDQGIAEKFD